ncbi:hypothetical protein ACOZ38_14615 [Sphaerisporangium viridialbum]|uniref:hypothetical protein n=1 Tax=Sphaerisporangium viridialbum TaxID=46189 RepID=UPI003C72828B
MRLRAILSATVLAGGLLVAPVAAGTADAAVCRVHQVGQHWECVTPGAFCSAAAHGKVGIAKVTGKRYQCKQSSPRWRWLR